VETRYFKGNPTLALFLHREKVLVFEDVNGKLGFKTTENNYKLRFSPIVNIS